MTERKLTIVCLSSQPWHDSMWTNKQHVMSRIAERHRVVFVNFGSERLDEVVRRRARETGSLPGPSALWRAPLVQRLSPSLEVLTIWSPGIANWLPVKSTARIWLEFERRVDVLGDWLRAQGISDAVIWVYHPGYGGAVERLPHSLIVYDCVDEYSAFPRFARAKEWIRERERQLCAAAGVVSCTAPTLYEAKKPLAPGRTHLVHNVGDATHFGKAMSPETPVPDDLASLQKPIIGFIGAVSDYKLNSEWLLHASATHPEWNVVVIGPVGMADPGTNVSELAARANVKLLGHRRYEELPAYLKGFDVAVIPYRINDYTRGVFPIKFFEFLASGKPVVISDLPAVERYWPAVRVAKTAEEFVNEVEQALSSDDAGARARRLELARENSWDSRVSKLLGLVQAALDTGAARTPG